MATFTYCPDFTLSESHKPQVRKTQFGDGYEQRIRFGLNSDPKVFSLKFENRSDAESVRIEEFLESNGGADSFIWTPPARNGGNRFLWSESFDKAAWMKSSLTVTANSQASPLGQTVADTITEPVSASSQHLMYQNATSYTSTGNNYVLSCYAKQGTGTRNLVLTSFGEPYTYFNVTTGTVALVDSSVKARITDAYNGWWRCSMAFTKTNATMGFYIGTANGTSNLVAGDGTSSLHIWGAQLELGTTPSDYNFTTTRVVGVRDVPGKYVCDEWEYTMQNADANTIQAKFRQVFEY
jgi:phage-related protein